MLGDNLSKAARERIEELERELIATAKALYEAVAALQDDRSRRVEKAVAERHAEKKRADAAEAELATAVKALDTLNTGLVAAEARERRLRAIVAEVAQCPGCDGCQTLARAALSHEKGERDEGKR